MGKLVYSMGVSLDGFIAGPEGAFDWATPDEELHRFHNQQTAQLGGHLLGRRLYETMVVWDTVDEESPVSDYEVEFARIWQELPKFVFSTTLESVEGANTILLTGEVAREVGRLKSQIGSDLAVGGARLAAVCMEHDLIDEYRLFVNPTIVGGGIGYFPTHQQRIDLELVETRTFGGQVVYLRYQRP
jgi:dihydrofolate reductase